MENNWIRAKIEIMTSTILSSCLLLIGLFSYSSYARTKKFTYKLAAISQADVRDSRFVQARIWSLRPEIKMKYRLLENVSFDSELEAYLETGSNDSLYLAEYRPRREVFMNSGKLVYRPLQWLSLDLGARNQDFFESPLFLTETAFAGIGQKIKFNIANIKIKIEAQQTIANNQNLSTRLNVVDEGTPKFYSESIGASIQNSNFEFSVTYSLWRFENLSRSVAHQSRFMGNQVNGTTQENASFLYRYQGHNTFARLQFRLQELSLHLSGHYLHNNQSPNSFSDGIWLMAGIGIQNLFLFCEFFENESDSTPAFYNEKFYGHNNYQGEVLGLFWRTPSSEISLNLRYIKASVMRISLYQDDFTGTQFSIAKDF